MPIARHLALSALILLAASSSAQDAVLDPETGLVLASVDLLVEPIDLAGGWLELTPLASDAEGRVVRLGDREVEDGGLRLRPGVPDGAAMLCSGGRTLGVVCEQVYLSGEGWAEPGAVTDLVVRFERGMAVVGRYLLDGWPMADARVAVVPAGLTTERAFTMPLGLEGKTSRSGAVRREVLSDGAGRFVLPRLAAGGFFLETILPSGRVHRSEPFELPSPRAARRETGAGDAEVVWDLGEIDVADGLVVELRVTDSEGLAIGGARVAGRQGETPQTLINYEAVTDRDGEARLSGFSATEGVHFSCRKEGYGTVRRDYPLLPVLVSCVLEPLAEVAGEVIGIDGLPPAGARVSLEALGSPADVPPSGAEASPEPAALDGLGRFRIAALAAGEYRLTAAAPGFEVEKRSIVLEPGQRLQIEAIVLLFGRELEGRVVDAETQKPLAGVEIRAVSPPGAAHAVSDEEGAFSLATRSDEALVLRLTAAEHAGREVTVAAQRFEEREPLVFEMERAGWVRAVVWDEAADLPCQSCRLLIRPSAIELSTDGYGEALSEPLVPGWYRVYRPRVTHLGSTVVEQADAEYRHVRVRRGRTSTVRFGERRRAVRVAFQPSPGPAWTLSARTPARSEKYFQTGGGFRVRQRRGESLDLFLHLYDPSSASEIEIRQATLPADFTSSELVLPLAGALLEGRATSGGEPLVGERVRLKSLRDATWASARTRSDGSFSIPHVPAGIYAVVIGERNVQFASLRVGQSLDLGTFELAGGSY